MSHVVQFKEALKLVSKGEGGCQDDAVGDIVIFLLMAPPGIVFPSTLGSLGMSGDVIVLF